MKKTAVEELTIMEAVDALSSMAEIDPKELKDNFLKLKAGEEPLRLLYWLDLKDPQKTLSNIQQMFRTLYRYLEFFYKEDRASLKESTNQRGIQAMMTIANEAVQSMDLCAFALNDQKVSDLKEYEVLLNYYNKRILSFIELEEEEELDIQPTSISEIRRMGLKDLEVVKKDRDYELFFIRREDGSTFFNRDLLRHLRLITNFDDTLTELQEQDPLTKLILVHDKEMHHSALQIRKSVDYDLHMFYKEALLNREKPLVGDVCFACMALMLSANPRHLMQNTTKKSALAYFQDFQMHMKKILSSADYLQLISNPIDPDDTLNQSMVHLIQALTYAFFTRTGHRTEMLGFIRNLMAKGKKQEGSSLWNYLIDVQEDIYNVLRNFPNGPLFKALDVFHTPEDFRGFDPITQGNQPSKMYVASFRHFHVDCLRMPSPTTQRYIQKANMTQEFKAFLQQLASHKRGDQHLMVNLQDRTSWEERARCEALEQAQMDAEISKNFAVVTLPKHTDFYYQTDVYAKINNADDFMNLVLEQVKSGEECGFFFIQSFPLKAAVSFTKKALPVIHKTFFGGKNVLSRKNRHDFIEIFYYFLTLKIIEEVQPHSLSFTCKDAVDIGAAMSAGFYSFLKMMSRSSDWQSHEKDFLLWMCFGPALSIRERVIDLQRLTRTISALACIDSELAISKEKTLKACSTLYNTPLFKEVSVFEAKSA